VTRTPTPGPAHARGPLPEPPFADSTGAAAGPDAAWPAPGLAGIRAEVDAALDGVLDRAAGRMAAGLLAPIRYALAAGGKRLRPALMVAASRAVLRGHGHPALPEAACAIELIHTYSLVHDDLPCMDDDALRRGRPTVHRVYGTRAAALAGVALIPLAFDVLERGGSRIGLARPARAALARELARGAGAGGMVGGQVLDLAAERRQVDATALEAIHARKTGALFEAALRMGGLAAGAPLTVVEALGRYGAALGLAFQIADDVLDETAETAVIGKTAGKDRRNRKATYPALVGLDRARLLARQAAERAVAAIRTAGIEDAVLVGLARFAAERDR
jgi:geranylgeranyl pyrophosphate synthase